ncbi:YdeI/OmpD-associated family protein [Aureimonas psammosilenae]|uniref:YdeI/OmpD-associated family protein n=1 Tax=Aureimonas psammosilenae TaxID=2495496 RepID=UPI00126138C1|nr:YdeI/OmpD-associated family protein [Aureimonas psammosilenae]
MSDVVAPHIKAGLPVLLFPDAAAFARWLEDTDQAARGAWLLFAKKGTDASSLSRQDAIDAALCEGWIDGQSATWDERFFLLRFTPRRPRGRWSQVNRQRALQLIEAGRMRDAGLAEVLAAQRDGRWDAAYPPSSTAVPPPDLQAALDGDPAAAARFAAMPKPERYALILKLTNARLATTRERCIAGFLAG